MVLALRADEAIRVKLHWVLIGGRDPGRCRDYIPVLAKCVFVQEDDWMRTLWVSLWQVWRCRSPSAGLVHQESRGRRKPRTHEIGVVRAVV